MASIYNCWLVARFRRRMLLSSGQAQRFKQDGLGCVLSTRASNVVISSCVGG